MIRRGHAIKTVNPLAAPQTMGWLKQTAKKQT